MIEVFTMRKFLYLIALLVIGLLDNQRGTLVGFNSAYADEDSKSSLGVVSRVISREERKCVEPESVMRKKHMDFLFHQRDEIMYYGGDRARPYSLRGCVACHVNRDEHGRDIPVNFPDQDCRRCHQYVAIKIDCFGCHAATPMSIEVNP